MKLENTRIIFMGTSFFAKEILKNLIENKIKIELVVTQPDKLAGRKKELKMSEVKLFAKKNNLKIEQFSKLDKTAFQKIKKINPDLVIVAAYGMIIPQKMLNQPRYGYVNIHTSILPKLRGSSPIQTSLLQGLDETGVTIMKMDTEIDSGQILSQKKIKIDSNDTYPVLEKKLITTAQQIIKKTINDYLEKRKIPKEQNHKQASFTKIIKKKDGKIDWLKSSKKIYNQFRAFYLWPQIYTFLTENKKITLTEIALSKINNTEKKVGEVYQSEEKTLIKTGQGSIIIKKIKLEGKNELPIKDFLNGNKKLIGTILK